MVDLEIVGAGPQDNIQNKIIVSVAGEDEILDYDRFGLTFESSEQAVLAAIRPMIQEKYAVDLAGPGGAWLYKTRKALTSRNIHIIPNSTAGAEHALAYLDNKARLNAYESLTAGCQHLWSKNKPQAEKIQAVAQNFAELAEKDPLFLAHFLSYTFKKLDTKDLKVMATFVNSLSDADGTPFVSGGEYHKPNLRLISAAAFMQLDPKLAFRVVKLANTKQPVGRLQNGTHFSKHLKTALKKYLRYRENNPKVLESARKAGFTSTFKALYRIAKLAPSPEACKVFRWKQKAGYPGADIKINAALSFHGLSDLDIAKQIRDLRLSPKVAFSLLPDKISPVIAASILEQCNGDDAVVYTSLFEEQGLLKHKEIRDLYDAKIRTAKQSLDRVERIKQNLDESTKQVMRDAKADVRKQQVGDIGSVFVHLDISGSMTQALVIAKDKGAIIAECVKNPEVNFHWGTFNNYGRVLNRPAKFTKDAFMAGLYGVTPGGGTNCLALFAHARQQGCETDVYITDGQHTVGDVATLLRQHQAQGGKFPKQVVIIKCGAYDPKLENGFKAVGIPVSTINEAQLTESALVTQAIKTAVLGAQALIDEVMATPLLELPKWWESVK
jgi:hypothetical protein